MNQHGGNRCTGRWKTQTWKLSLPHSANREPRQSGRFHKCSNNFTISYLNVPRKQLMNTSIGSRSTAINIRVTRHMIEVCLHSQSAPEKHNQEKKPTNLCVLREFLEQMCRPCLIVVKSYFYFSQLPAACSAFCALFTWSRRTTCAKDYRHFYVNYPQTNETRKYAGIQVISTSDRWQATNTGEIPLLFSTSVVGSLRSLILG